MSIHKRHGPRGVRYEVRQRGPDGREVSRTFTTRRDAETYQAAQRTARHQGSWIDPRHATRTFESVAVEWLASNPAKRPTSWARDEVDLRVHVLPAIGSRRLNSLTPADVQGLVNEWSTAAAPRTVQRRYGTLRAVLNHAMLLDLIGRTPCRGINLPKPEPVDRHILDSADLEALATALGDFGSMAYLGAVLGLRWGEVAGLRVARLDLMSRPPALRVEEQVVRAKRGEPTTGPPKSRAGRRTLTMPNPLATMLSAHLARSCLTAADGDAFVFTSSAGTHLTYSNWRPRVWVPATEAAGLAGLGFHDLRRANATGLVAEGVDLKTAQARLGHSDPRLTLAVYARATTAGDQAAADALGGRFMAPTDVTRGKNAG